MVLILAHGLTAIADETEPKASSSSAMAATGKNGATVTRWAEGFDSPQGLAVDPAGVVFLVENGKGRVLRFTRDGRQKGVAAAELRAPAFAALIGSTLYVSERKGNSVAEIRKGGAVTRLSGTVVDPLGLAAREGNLLVVSHRQSVVERWAQTKRGFMRIGEPYLSPPSGTKYGWRDIAAGRDGTIYITDELSGAVLRRTAAGGLTGWVSGLSSPSGLALSPDGAVYVTEEGNGRLSRLTNDGRVTLLAEGLGTARDVAFLDARSLLVSDRAGGNVWKVVLPQLP